MRVSVEALVVVHYMFGLVSASNQLVNENDLVLIVFSLIFIISKFFYI